MEKARSCSHSLSLKQCHTFSVNQALSIVPLGIYIIGFHISLSCQKPIKVGVMQATGFMLSTGDVCQSRVDTLYID